MNNIQDSKINNTIFLAIVSLAAIIALSSLSLMMTANAQTQISGKNKSIDLAVTNNDDNKISILLGKGNGKFGTATNYETGDHPGHIIADDFNKDKFLDLAVTNGNDRNVSVFLGKGDGTFGEQNKFGEQLFKPIMTVPANGICDHSFKPY